MPDLSLKTGKERPVEQEKNTPPLLLFLPNPSLSTTSSAHCILLRVFSPFSPPLLSASSSLVAPRKCNTACGCAGLNAVVTIVGRAGSTCVCAARVPRGVEERDIVAILPCLLVVGVQAVRRGEEMVWRGSKARLIRRSICGLRGLRLAKLGRCFRNAPR